MVRPQRIRTAPSLYPESCILNRLCCLTGTAGPSPSPACSLQLAACSLQLAACSLQLAACSLQLAACS
ncbi:MAG TPA: hypothetical protein EYG00_08715, partial [Alcanivorax sp.]|nr:hypothetical protein [Alcanivorax sp.]